VDDEEIAFAVPVMRGVVYVNEGLDGEEVRAALAGFWWGQRPYCLIDNEAGLWLCLVVLTLCNIVYVT
jgi:hypothetical protein